MKEKIAQFRRPSKAVLNPISKDEKREQSRLDKNR